MDAAIRKGVEFLLSQQDISGAIVDQAVRAAARPGINRMDNATAMTSLAIMALAAVGHQPADPTPQGKAMARALDFVLRDDRQEADGYFGKSDGSRMYGHGITTLMLAEMLGMGTSDKQDELIHKRLEKAVALILRAQKVRKDARYEGGWRYAPDAPDADISISVWQVMALRAARNAGLEVPKAAIDAAVKYIKRSYSERSRFRIAGAPQRGFTYTPDDGAMRYSTSSAGLLALQVCGEYEAKEVQATADALRDLGKVPANETWLYYGTYYFAQAMYQRGGDHAELARRVVAEALLPLQDPRTGQWKSREPGGVVYSTSLAMLSLSVKYHYMPIYQR